jgi:DNA-binding response OmpR family regulator
MNNSENPAESRVPRILVVEDQADTRKLIVATLGLRHYAIEQAADSDTGWAKLQVFKPDLVLLDVMMPGRWDGIELCRHIREAKEFAGVKIAMITAKGQKQDLEAGRQAKADAYVVKPFGPMKLLETVEWLLA